MTKIKAVRVRRDIKQAELARILKVSRAAVCDIEKKGIHSISTAKKYAAVLGCPAIELIEI